MFSISISMLIDAERHGHVVRRLAVMCEGARNLGLDENYTARLARHACIKGSPPLPASETALTNSAKVTEYDKKGLRHLTLDELACFDGRPAQSLSVRL